MNLLEVLKTKLPKLGENETIELQAIYDPATNKVYLQTQPYFRGDKIIVKRVAEFEVTVEQAYNLVTEYELSTTYEGEINE